MQLVVGLRNPGSDYKGSRHNLGEEIVVALADRLGLAFSRGPRQVPAVMAQHGTGDQRTILILPNTFMNESGRAVASALRYFKVAPENVLVAHDDIDLAFGRLRVQEAGGSGGHNGIRSLESAIGSDFWRLKAGVGRPPGSQDPADFVLRLFSRKERPEVDLIAQDGADVAELWVSDRAKSQEVAAHRGRDV